MAELHYLDKTGTGYLWSKIKQHVSTEIGKVKQLSFVIVDELPELAQADLTKIYLLLRQTPGQSDYYDEYICIESGTPAVRSWEKIGDTHIDLSQYYTKTESDNRFVKTADEITVDFYVGDDVISTKTIHSGDGIIDYPALQDSEYNEYGYWDKELDELREITTNTDVVYDVPKIVYIADEDITQLVGSAGEANIVTDQCTYDSTTHHGVLVYDKKITQLYSTFYNLSVLGNLTLPESVTKLGYCSCYKCQDLVYIYLPDSITEIGQAAFSMCIALDFTSLPSELKTIGNYAFYNCSALHFLTSLPSGVTSIGECAFQECTNLALTSLPSELTSIGNRAFYNCSKLAFTELPSGLTSIGISAFYNCTNLALTSLPSGLTNIDGGAFWNCTALALTSLPSVLTSIGLSAFRNCTNLALTSLPSSITSISSNAFSGCTNLDIKELPANLSFIGNYAFQDCVKMTDLKILNTTDPIELGTNAFSGVNITRIQVPNNLLEQYKTAPNWSQYASVIGGYDPE